MNLDLLAYVTQSQPAQLDHVSHGRGSSPQVSAGGMASATPTISRPTGPI
jgi:hypothetical protein